MTCNKSVALPGFESKCDTFLKNFTFNTTGIYDKESKDDAIRFSWKRKRQAIQGLYTSIPGFTESTIMLSDSSNPKHEQIYHFIRDIDETLEYFNGTDCKWNPITLNLTRGTISYNDEERPVTLDDYAMFTELLDRLTNEAKKALPYLKPKSDKVKSKQKPGN